jgi:hypothetical protein
MVEGGKSSRAQPWEGSLTLVTMIIMQDANYIYTDDINVNDDDDDGGGGKVLHSRVTVTQG